MDSKSNTPEILNSDALSERIISIEKNAPPKDPEEAAIKVWDSFFLNSEGVSSDFMSDRLPDDK